MNHKKIFVVIITLVVAAVFVSLAPAFADVDTAWVRIYNGPGNTEDWANAIAVDSCGNVYVTGKSGSYPDYDYLTIKYYPNGDIAWVRRYNGPGNYSYGASAIAVYGCDKVYVAGIRCEPYQICEEDYTIAYDATNGDSLWVGNYGGEDIAVDGSDNVYVTGASNHDYLTVKYRSNGDVAWAETYDGPGHRTDKATAIAVDDSGNVYVTGYSDQDSSSPDMKADYATIKYDSLGTQLWVERYDYSEDDVAYDIAVDDSGNVYVTGWSDDILDNLKSLHGEQTGYDNPETGSLHHRGFQHKGPPLWFHFATIKYYPDGDTAWVRRYSKPGANAQTGGEAIAVDGSGNVYVTGSSDWEYATIKYYTDGNLAWLRSYGPENSLDWAEAIAVDGSGNVYVTGYSGPDETSPYYDYATIKYDSLGNECWVERYNGPANSYDHALAIAVDGSGNIYVTGYSHSSGTNYDYATIKYKEWCSDYRIEEPSHWCSPPLKVTPNGSRDLRFKVFNCGNEDLIYNVSSDHPCIQVSASGTLPPRDSASVWVYVDGTGVCNGTFIDGNVILWTSAEDKKIQLLPVQAIVSDDYYECPIDPETFDTLENSIESVQSGLKLYVNANCQEWFHYYDPVKDTTHEVGFQGGIIVATIRDGDTLVGRSMGANDHKTDAQDILHVDQCDMGWEPPYWLIYTEDIFINDLDPPMNDKWFCWVLSKQVKFFKPTAPPEYRNIVIKYVKVKRQGPPGWWPGGTEDCTDYENTYIGMAMDIDCPWDTMGNQNGRNLAGYDATNHIAYQQGWEVTGEHSDWNNFYCGIALAKDTDDTTAVLVQAPFGTYNVRNDSFLYPQSPWGWLDQELYELAADGVKGVIQDPDTTYGLDRTQVFTALEIPAGSDPDAEYSFILVEAVAPTGLAELQELVALARLIVARENNYEPMSPSKCGDVTDDDVIDLGDLLFLIAYLYKGGPAPDPLASGDVNSDGVVDLGDVLYIIAYLYKGGPKPNCLMCPYIML